MANVAFCAALGMEGVISSQAVAAVKHLNINIAINYSISMNSLISTTLYTELFIVAY